MIVKQPKVSDGLMPDNLRPDKTTAKRDAERRGQMFLAAASNRKKTIEALYQRFQPVLLAYTAGLMPGGVQDAHEILQELYIRLLRLDDLSKLEQNPRAYLYTIATNLVRDQMRRQSARKFDQHVDISDVELASSDQNPPQSAGFSQTMGQLKQALLNLKPQTRQIFILSRFEEMTYPEIAEQLNISSRTVERHMSSALDQLQQALGSHLEMQL